MLKPCPKCKKLSAVETRICTCGFWFIENKLAETLPDFRQTKKEKFKRSVTKFLVLTGFVIFVAAAAAAVLGGFTGFFQSSENDDEKSALIDLPDDTQNVLPASRFPKGRIEGRVVAVNSGELITVVDAGNREYKIRLGGIDAPESGDDFGQSARDHLAALVLDKDVLVNLQKIDEGGLLVGKVLLGERNVNLEQIKAGFALNDRNLADLLPEDDRRLYVEAENDAKKAGAGLWSNLTTKTAEVPGETAFVPADAKALSENKSPASSEVTPNPSPTAQIRIPEQRTENEIPSGFTVFKPAASPSPSLTDNRPTRESSSPVRENNQSKPAGKTSSAIARCADGTLSYSPSRSGACSNHGGVANWLDGSNSIPKTKISERTYIRGPRGGCYYLNPNGRKTYVDQKLCG